MTMRPAIKEDDAVLEPALQQIKDALNDPNCSIRFVQTFSYGTAVQVYIKTRKIGPFILPRDDQTLADVLYMLGELR